MTESQYIVRPYIQFDGKDENGVRAEVGISEGFAEVTNMKRSKNRESGMVQVSFEAPSSQYPTNGWLNRDEDKEVFDIVKEAYDAQTPIHFRVEQQRKRGVNRTLTLKEITGFNPETGKTDRDESFKNTFRYLSAVRVSEDDVWVETSRAVTYANKKGSASGVYKATAEDEMEAHGNDDSSTPSVKRSEGGASNAPFIGAFMADGSVNHNSYAYDTVVAVNMFVRAYLKERNLEDMFNKDETHTIKLMFLRSVANTQKHMTGVNKTDMNTYSYRIAEKIVRFVMTDMNPMKDTMFNNDFRDDVVAYFKQVVFMSREVAKESTSIMGELG